MPGHSTEVLATYPDLACDLPEPRRFEVHPFWEGIVALTQPLCAGNDKVYAMYQDILAEVIDLFPSPYIHVGGDEVPKDAWKKCPRCQARIKAEGLKDEEELQSYFMRRIEKVVEAKGRRLIGWDEILEGGLAPGASVMSWRGTKGGVAAAQLGHDVVMTPNPYTYFDYTYHTTPTKKVYSYDPAATEFTPALAQHILGVQASMWTHIAVTPEAIDYQIYPRLLALAEAAWTPQRMRDWSDFSSRADSHFSRLESLDIKYCDVSAPGKRLGAWQASDLTGETPRQFTWEATTLIPNSGEFQVQVRHDDGEKLTYVRSVALLEDGKEISRAAFPGPLDKTNDVNIGWLAIGERQVGSRYVVRVTLQGS
jgi:hexosaminidase